MQWRHPPGVVQSFVYNHGELGQEAMGMTCRKGCISNSVEAERTEDIEETNEALFSLAVATLSKFCQLLIGRL